MQLRPGGQWIVSFALAMFVSSTVFAQSKTWTTDADFDSGVLDNVVHTPANQIDLGPTVVSQSHTVWATNYAYGAVVKLDTVTGRQTARYDSVLQTVDGAASGARPPREVCNWWNAGNCPSAVAVDTNGDAWVVNAAYGNQGTVTKIAGDITHCVDRNGNSTIETSTDRNGDGLIDVNLANPNLEFFGQNDECILTTFAVGGFNAEPRSIAIDKNGKVWVPTSSEGKIYRYNPDPPYSLEAEVYVAGYPFVNPFQVAAGGDYILISDLNNSVQRVNISTLAFESVTCPYSDWWVVAMPAGDIAWLGGDSRGIYKVDFTSSTCIPIAGTLTAGMTLDLAGNIWAANQWDNTVTKVSPAWGVLGTYPAAGAFGLSVDFQGNIWMFPNATVPSVFKIDSTTGLEIGSYSIDALSGQIPSPNADPYLTGDSTGAQINRQAPYAYTGSWDGTFDGQIAGLSWSTVYWNTEPQGAVPAGTSLVVSARAADDLTALSLAAYTPATNDAALTGISGRYVQVQAELTGPGWVSPALSDITVEGPCPTPGDACCLSAADCDDGNPLTTDSCPTVGGACSHVLPTSTPTQTPTPTNTPTITPTVTPTPEPLVPPDSSTDTCEDTVAKNLKKLAVCTANCQVKEADHALNKQPFDEIACEEGTGAKPISCRAAYDKAQAAVLAKTVTVKKVKQPICPACLGATAQSSLADAAMSFVEQLDGQVYCAGTTGFPSGNPGFVPPDKNTDTCEDTASRNVRTLARCITKCEKKQADAALKNKSFDVQACEQGTGKPISCRAAYDKVQAAVLAKTVTVKKVKQPICPACLGATAQGALADAMISFIAQTSGGQIYCAGTIPLP
jgi:streptogramin lyase